MKQKKKIVECHGKIEDFDSQIPQPSLKRQPLTLEEVWGGINELERYGTKDRKIYESQLRDMNRSDLETHSRKLGVVILESSSRLRDKLLNEFDIYISALKDPPDLVTGATTNKNRSKIPSEEIRKILAEGR